MKVSLQCYNNWFWTSSLRKHIHMQPSVLETKVLSMCSPLHRLLDPTSDLPASLSEAVEVIRPKQNQINDKLFPEIDSTRPHDLNINVWNETQYKKNNQPNHKTNTNQANQPTKKKPKPNPVPVLCVHVPKYRKLFYRMTSIKHTQEM